MKPHVPHQTLTDILTLPVAEWKDYLVNDFEKSVFDKYPAIESIKKEFYNHGALYASMSGSGSSVFGIFLAPTELSHQFKGMQYWGDYLN